MAVVDEQCATGSPWPVVRDELHVINDVADRERDFDGLGVLAVFDLHFF